MAELETLRVQLDYPLNVVRDPIIYHLVTDFRLVPNIRRANIDSHTGGMLALEIQGTPDDLAAGMEYLRGLGITVTTIGAESSWTI
jgi:ABC-type methionine transport system ATPase subunit